VITEDWFNQRYTIEAPTNAPSSLSIPSSASLSVNQIKRKMEDAGLANVGQKREDAHHLERNRRKCDKCFLTDTLGINTKIRCTDVQLLQPSQSDSIYACQPCRDAGLPCSFTEFDVSVKDMRAWTTAEKRMPPDAGVLRASQNLIRATFAGANQPFASRDRTLTVGDDDDDDDDGDEDDDEDEEEEMSAEDEAKMEKAKMKEWELKLD
jgi:hypothetical protein